MTKLHLRVALCAVALCMSWACSGGPSPQESCEEAAVASCAKVYECLSADEIMRASLPATESGCVTQLQTTTGCANVTEDNICEGNETYNADEVDPCLEQTESLSCNQVRGGMFEAPACDRICSVE